MPTHIHNKAIESATETEKSFRRKNTQAGGNPPGQRELVKEELLLDNGDSGDPEVLAQEHSHLTS